MAYTYKGKTNFFKIPYMEKGDYMTQEDNSLQMNMVDGLLYSAIGATPINCMLSEGYAHMETVYEEDETTIAEAKLVISVNPDSGFSLFGIYKSHPFYKRDELNVLGFNITGQESGNVLSTSESATYHVYAEFSDDLDGLYEDPTNFTLRYYNEEQEGLGERMKLYEIVIIPPSIGGEITEPTYKFLDFEKAYGTSILSHILDSENPHGSVLHQDSIEIADSLKIDGSDVYGIEIGSVLSPGSSSFSDVSFPDGKDVLFVSAFAENVSAGNIAWSIDQENRKVTFYNSGEHNVTINYRFDVLRRSSS